MPSNFIYLYFYFCYYLFFVPYRFQRLENGMYKLHTCLSQKVICGIFHFCALCIYGTSLRRAVEVMSINTPVSYFRVFENTFSIMYKSLIVKCLWLNQDVFLKILNFLQQENFQGSLTGNPKKVESPRFLIVVYLYHLILCLARLLNPTVFPLSQIPKRQASENGILYDWYHSIVAESRYIFFQPNDSLYSTKLEFSASYSCSELTAALITTISLAAKFIMGIFVDVGLLMVVLTLRSPVVDFENLLKSTNYGDSNPIISKSISTSVGISSNRCKSETSLSCTIKTIGLDFVVERYELLRRLSKLINQAFGEVIIPFIGEGIFTYAINFKDVLFLGELSQGCVVFSFYAMFFLILQTASSICRKVREMKEWLHDNEKHLHLSNTRMTILLDSISKDSVGIAFSGIVTINYSLVGTMASILVTYFIVRLQSKE